jgi:hypothetical protein
MGAPAFIGSENDSVNQPVCELRHFRPPFVMSDLVFLLRNDGMAGKSPLKAKPLRNPGDSVDEEIDRHINDREGSVTRED